MNISAKTQRIIDWRESMATMEEGLFFDIMRMYLGEVKTPYNKQKLIEGLSSFLRKTENREILFKLLGSSDLKILTVVKNIRNCTEEKILSFIEGNGMAPRLRTDLSGHIQNLKERLILFTFVDKESKSSELRINPLLEDDLYPLLQTKILFENPEDESKPKANANKELPSNTTYPLSPQLLASFISFVVTQPDLCKNDGSLKKHIVEELQEVFTEIPKSYFEKLTSAFINLSILSDEEKGWMVDFARLENFSLLDEKSQYIYLSTASLAHFPRKTMQVFAQTFFCTLYTIPPTGCTQSQMLQLYLLQKEKSTQQESSSRFARMLSSASALEGDEMSSKEVTEVSLVKNFIEAAVEFSLLTKFGSDSLGQELYTRSAFFDSKLDAKQDSKNLLSIDSAFSVTILPGLSLHDLLPFAKFMQIHRYDTAAVFEINRRSAIRAFDAGFTPQTIIQLLEKYSSYKIQQNIQVNLEEWFTSYKSVSLYKGYVLKADRENARFVKNNPVLAPFIKEELAEGLFFFSFSDDIQAQSVLSKSGLDFIGSMKVVQNANLTLGFFPLDEPEQAELSEKNDSPDFKVDKEKQKAILESLKADLAEMNLTPDQREGLLDRINRKIVLNKTQLVGESVRFEKVEAGGMDYTGKIHVIERAILNGGVLEVELDGGDCIAGKPLELNKKTPGALLLLECSDSGEKISIPVSSAVRIKKTRRLLNLD